MWLLFYKVFIIVHGQSCKHVEPHIFLYIFIILQFQGTPVCISIDMQALVLNWQVWLQFKIFQFTTHIVSATILCLRSVRRTFLFWTTDTNVASIRIFGRTWHVWRVLLLDTELVCRGKSVCEYLHLSGMWNASIN